MKQKPVWPMAALLAIVPAAMLAAQSAVAYGVRWVQLSTGAHLQQWVDMALNALLGVLAIWPRGFPKKNTDARARQLLQRVWRCWRFTAFYMPCTGRETRPCQRGYTTCGQWQIKPCYIGGAVYTSCSW